VRRYRRVRRTVGIWRHSDGKELDCVEEHEGWLFGCGFKWQGQVRPATRQEFTVAYPGAEVATITSEDCAGFLG
jgi:hypothetical protein